MLPAWLAVYGATPSVAREVRFSFEFEGATVTGVIDRVGQIETGGSQITDYKTGRARGGRGEDNLQLGIYYLAVARSEELAAFRPVKAVELAFLNQPRREGILRIHSGMNSQAQREFEKRMAERLSDLIGQIRELNRTETYSPSPRANCRFCDFKPLCPLWPEGRGIFPEPREVLAAAGLRGAG
jgi:putative RecB family exonuclease